MPEKDQKQSESTAAPAEGLPEQGDVQAITSQVRSQTKEVLMGSELEQFILELQAQGKVPESPHVHALSKTLEFLGKVVGLRIELEGQTFFPSNLVSLELTPANLKFFLKRAVFASALIAPLMAPSAALASGLQVGSNLIDSSVTKVVESGYTMYHWENIALALLVLGVSGWVVKKIVDAHKNPKKEQKKELKEKFKKYEKAKKSKDKKAIKDAKFDLYGQLMGDLPQDMEGALDNPNVDVQNLDELNQALEIKLETDQVISKAIGDLMKGMIFSGDESLDELSKLKEKLSAEFNQQAKKLHEFSMKLWEKHGAKGSPFMQKQTELQKHKLKYIEEYLLLLAKKWLVIIQSKKNEIISDTPAEQIAAKYKTEKNILNLKQKLSDLLDGQEKMKPEDFSKELKTLEKDLESKTPKEPEQSEQLGLDALLIHNQGQYTPKTGVLYAINTQEKSIPLPPNTEFQLWFSSNKTIKFNLLHKGKLWETGELIIGPQTKELQLANNPSLSLPQYITAAAKKFPDDSKVTADTGKSDAELAPEAEPVMGALVQACQETSEKIKNGKYETFGKHIKADDEALEFHLIRVHREYHQNKASTVVRFTLSESYWQKALAKLKQQSDVPSTTFSVDFENENGNKKTVSQQCLKFNVLKNGKKATVLVASSKDYLALAGEVKVIFDSETAFSAEELRSILAETFSKLDIAGEIKPVTPVAKGKLEAKLKKRSKKDVPVSATAAVHPEYEASQTNEQLVQELKEQGLHSLYHSFKLEHLESIFGAGQLLSTTTRFSKGLFAEGMSSLKDVETGGATEAFTRIHTKDSAKKGIWYGSGKPALVFGPELFKRMDHYCYTSDTYGSKVPSAYEQRVDPKTLVKMMVNNYSSSNETMFFDAVSLQDARYIVYSNPAEIIARLEKLGIKKLGGKSLKEAVITPEQFKSINL